MQKYNICFSLDSHYVEQFCVSAVSILKNSLKDEKFKFYILDGGLTKVDKTNIESLKEIKDFEIEYLSINVDDFKNCPLLNKISNEHKDYHITIPTYFRFKLPTLIKDIDKILYLDCDVIVRKSLHDLYNKNIDGNAACMCLDVESKQEATRLGLKEYFNAGVMLINLDYWRKNNIEEKLFEYAKNNADKILWQDQDVINVILKSKILNLSNKWNYQYFLYNEYKEAELFKSVIMHLAGRFKPWLIPFEHFLYDCYYYYLLFTPYKNNILEYRQKSKGKHLKNDVGGNITNIERIVFDEDLQKVYEEITKSYGYTNSVKDKLLEIYETQKQENYKACSTLNEVTDEKIHKVYEEITKNYEYTNEIRDNLTSELEKTFQNIEQKQEEKNFNLEKYIETTNEVSTSKTDEKIHKVYEEITKNYEYTNDIRDNLTSNLAKTFQDIEQKQEEKNFNFEKYIETTNEVLTYKTDEKIHKVYEEITKNYEYTNSIRDNFNSQLEQKTQEIKEEQTNKIQDLRQEQDNKVKDLKQDQDNKIQDLKQDQDNKIQDLKQEQDNKVKDKINDISSQIDTKIENLNDNITENINNIDREQTRQNDLKNSEIYSYTNNELLKLLNQLTSFDRNIQNKIEAKAYESYKLLEENKNEINNLRNVLNSKTDVEMLDRINDRLQIIENNHQKQLNEMIVTFDEKLNEQRIKYENKLMSMEESINDLDRQFKQSQKSLITKIVEKYKKR